VTAHHVAGLWAADQFLAAQEIVRLYRLRWRIEQVFRSMKSDGLRLEETQIQEASRLFKLAAMALTAVVRTIQLVDARDGSLRPASDVADEDLIPAAEAIGPTLERKWHAKKTRIRHVLSPGCPGSLLASADGTAISSHQVPRPCELVGTVPLHGGLQYDIRVGGRHHEARGRLLQAASTAMMRSMSVGSSPAVAKRLTRFDGRVCEVTYETAAGEAAIRAEEASTSNVTVLTSTTANEFALLTVGIIALVAVATGIWLAIRPTRGPEISATTPRLSIVVLPFANLSSDPAQDFLADALTEELDTSLSRISGTFVIARSTAFTYKGKPVDVKQIGRDLSVRYVMEGSEQRVGDQIRVSAQLIDAETGAHLWADQVRYRSSRPAADAGRDHYAAFMALAATIGGR
jgi:TolB-like protein